jgi:hypothetical protein
MKSLRAQGMIALILLCSLSISISPQYPTTGPYIDLVVIWPDTALLLRIFHPYVRHNWILAYLQRHV